MDSFRTAGNKTATVANAHAPAIIDDALIDPTAVDPTAVVNVVQLPTASTFFRQELVITDAVASEILRIVGVCKVRVAVGKTAARVDVGKLTALVTAAVDGTRKPLNDRRSTRPGHR